MADTSNIRKGQPKRNSDARREQNRLASRNYREKRKQKLALLNQILVSDNGQSGEEVISSDSTSVTGPSAEAPVAGSPALPTGLATSAAPRPSTSLMRNLTNHGWPDVLELPPDTLENLPDLGKEPLPFMPDAPLRTETLAPTLLGTSATSGNSHMQFGGSLGFTLPFPESEPRLDPQPEPETGPELDADETIMSILKGVQNLSLKQKQGLLRQLQHEVKDADGEDSHAHSISDVCALVPNNWVSAYPRMGQPTTRLQYEARRFAAFVDRYSSGTVGPAQLSRIYSTEAGYFAALFANCYALGMNDVEPLMVEEGVSVFSLGPDTGYHPSQLAVVRPKFEGVTADLKPCDQQLTFGHHPYLDVLPFKMFREKALKVLDNDASLLDENQLCIDLTTGLFCWGSVANPLGMEAGVPWDVRSWEPKVWFLKKYWYLVGGWDDEMWKMARWWHDLRNEKLPV